MGTNHFLKRYEQAGSIELAHAWAQIDSLTKPKNDSQEKESDESKSVTERCRKLECIIADMQKSGFPSHNDHSGYRGNDKSFQIPRTQY